MRLEAALVRNIAAEVLSRAFQAVWLCAISAVAAVCDTMVAGASRPFVEACYRLPSLSGGESYSFVVRNGTTNLLRCLAAGGGPHNWKAFRLDGNSIGRPIDVRSFESAEGFLRFVTDDTVNTGIYFCVDAADEHVVLEEYVILTESECDVVRLWNAKCGQVCACMYGT